MRSLLLLIFFLYSFVASAGSWRNYTHPSEPLYEGSFTGGPTAPRAQFRVITINLQFAKKVEALIELWKKEPYLHEADAVLLQEVVGEPGSASAHTAEILSRRLNLNYAYVPAFVHKKNGKDFGVAVLSPHPLSEAEKVILPYPHFLDRTQRVAVGVTIHAPGGNVRAYSIHAETLQFTYQRNRQVRKVLNAARSWQGTPAIVGGDFNSVPLWQRWSMFRNVRRQGWSIATEKVRGDTLRAWGGLIRMRLDHILSRGIKPKAAGKLPRTSISDHAFVWADFPVH